MSPLSVLGVIPARAGSKRLADKNVRLLGGRPLIQHTIDAAAASELLTRTIVSTDDESIAAVAAACGGEVPFLRPGELATDTATDRAFLCHALDWYAQETGGDPDAVAILRPTSPFKTGAMIDAGIRLLAETGADSVRSMTLVEGVHHPYWMFRRGDDGRAAPFDAERSPEQYPRSQMLPPLFRLNGVVDFALVSVVRDATGPLYGADMRVLEIEPDLAHDIDTESDLALCEAVLASRSADG